MYKNVYIVRIGDQFAKATIKTMDSGRISGYHLHFLSHHDRVIFDYYHIRYSDFAYVIPDTELSNGIPVGPEKDIRTFINYINMTYCVCDGSKFSVNDNIIICNKHKLEITQTRSGNGISRVMLYALLGWIVWRQSGRLRLISLVKRE